MPNFSLWYSGSVYGWVVSDPDSGTEKCFETKYEAERYIRFMEFSASIPKDEQEGNNDDN